MVDQPPTDLGVRSAKQLPFFSQQPGVAFRVHHEAAIGFANGRQQNELTNIV